MKSHDPSPDPTPADPIKPALSDEKMLQLVYKALDEVNLQLPQDRRVPKAPQTRLFGRQGKLDSLGLVSFVAALEVLIEDECGVRVNLADEDAMSQPISPFESVELLVSYLAGRIGRI